MNAISRTAAAAAVGLGLATLASTSVQASDQKDIAIGLLEQGLAKSDRAYVMEHVGESYRQHNPVAADGRAGLLGFIDYLGSLDKPLKVKPVRVLEEGDLVVVQSEYEFFGPKVIFDLFRFEDGKLAEHWDAMQEVPETTANGRTMTDGTVELVDVDKTADNKALVTAFVTDVLLKGEIDKIDSYLRADYMQHSPLVPDTREGLKGFISWVIENKIQFGYTKIHNVVAEGNFVFTQSEGSYDNKPTAFYDLFRVEDGQIVEHWDVVQEIPAEMAHENGMF